MEKRHKRRRYLIDRRFQLRWALTITLAGGLTAAVLSSLLWLSIDRQNELLAQAIEMDQQLQKESKDAIVLLLNMPGTTATEAKKHKQRFKEISRRTESSSKIKTELMGRNRWLRYWLIGFVIVLTGGLFIWGVYLTHRVAGPLFVIRRHLETLQEEGTVDTRPLRKHDELKHFYRELCEVLDGFSPRDKERSGDG